LRIAHITDLHLTGLPRRRPGITATKRLLSWLSWQRRRRHRHRPEQLQALVSALRREAPDAWAVTGDLCQTGLPREIGAARAWLEGLDAPDHILLVPGNHDVFGRDSVEPVREQWAPFLHIDPASPAGPAVRRFGDVVLIGLNSAVVTPITRATGRLGRALRERLAGELDRHRGRCRVVLLHHPPLPGVAAGRKALVDAAETAEVLARHGAALVLHGHLHANAEWRHATTSGEARVYCTASASATTHGDVASGRVFDVRRCDDGFRIDMKLVQLDARGRPTTAASDHWISAG
jgi:3',5'-cyclic AMP phosphodiesterase CpdA